MKAMRDFASMRRQAYRWLLASVAAMSLLTAVAFAQSQTTSAPQRPASPESEITSKMQAARNDPAQYVELLVRLVKEFPESRYTESAGFNFSSILKKQAQKEPDPAKMRALAESFIAGTASAPGGLRMRINSTAIRAMLDNNLAEQAATLARQTVAVLNEKEYLAFIRKGYERDIESALKTNPNYKPRPFSETEYSERFRQESATYYSLLGRAHLKLNDLTQAEAAFKRSYEISLDAPAAAGLATVLEKRGKDAEAIEYMTQAMLTGKLDKAGIEQFQNLYRRTHGGKLDGIEEYLDARYRQSYRSPLKGDKHAPNRASTGRAVLAEFFTGAGCIPCIPFDYTFETALEDYSRNDLVLLVYHWHAPTLDPMGNRSNDARVTYYGVQGAPTVFLNGQRFNDKGDGDARIKSEAEKKTTSVYASVTSVINKELETPAPAQLKLTAERSGKGVKATVAVEDLKDASPDITLHFALVEDEVHYSGENGLRFHPMVVRNLAKTGNDYGFKVAPGQANKFEHTFDLESISAENLRYYDEWPAERNKEVNARIGGDADFDVGKFKEQRHLINPNKLSVVAFLQDNKTKAILQAVYHKLSSTAPAQTQTPRPAITRPADEDALQKAAVIKDPQERVEALIKVVNDYPRAVYIRNVGFYLMRGLNSMSNEPEKVRALINRFVEGTASAPAYARTEFYSGIARNLLSSGILLDRAAELAQQGVALLSEEGYVDNERRGHEQKEAYFTARDPNRKAEPFSLAEATEKYRVFHASHYATLGRLYFKLNRIEEAEKTLKQAYAIKPTMEAATGLADVAEKRGKDAEAFEYLADAILTGRLPASGIERLHNLYRKSHGGKLDGLEAYLDAKYRRSFHHSLKVERYKPAGGRATESNARAVLAEFVTGAGCEPCTAVDLAFDGALERYSRRELILLVYPMHAPTSDPMSNHSAQARHKFYNLNSAPTIMMDGQNFKAGEGLATEAERVWKNLDAGIAARLSAPAQARLKLSATRAGATVKVTATADEIKNAAPDLRLHLALVEDEVSYSGENGLRFHPMVVRNLARQTDAQNYGFAVNAAQGAKVDYVFDLEQITAANLKYYDEYIADFKQRLGIEPTFKEKRYLINPERLSIVAFVQDEKTKQILQAVYLKVAAGSQGNR